MTTRKVTILSHKGYQRIDIPSVTSLSTMETNTETIPLKSSIPSPASTSKLIKCCRWERNLVRNIPIVFAIIGLLTGTGYTLADIFWLYTYYQVVPAGMLLASSIIMIVLGSIAKEIQYQVDRFKEENIEFQTNLAQQRIIMKNEQEENKKLNDDVESFKKDLDEQQHLLVLEKTISSKFDNENEELKTSILAMKQTVASLLDLRDQEGKVIAALEAENTELKDSEEVLKHELDKFDKELNMQIAVVAALQNELEESKALVVSLRAFQKKSVEIIQVLTLYGDEAKATGTSLKTIAQDLLQTDHTLHDNVEELGNKLQVLDKILEHHGSN